MGSMIFSAAKAVWDGPFYIGKLEKPISVAEVLLKFLETAWRAMVSLMALGLATLIIASATSAKSVRTKGYVKRDGTYVMPSFKTSPDSSRLNNYSTKGNVNPYTGKMGTRDPYKPKPLNGF